MESLADSDPDSDSGDGAAAGGDVVMDSDDEPSSEQQSAPPLAATLDSQLKDKEALLQQFKQS